MRAVHPASATWTPVLTLLVLTAGCRGPDETGAPTLPNTSPLRIAAAPAALEFGEVPLGKPVSADVFVRNVGDEEVVIQKVETSCGCTAAKLVDATIPPHREARLSIRLESPFLAGARSTKVTIITAEGGSLAIPIRGVFVEKVRSTPPRVSAIIEPGRESVEFHLSLTKHPSVSGDFRLDSDDPAITFQGVLPSGPPRAPGETAEIVVRAALDKTTHFVSGSLVVSSKADGTTLCRIPISCTRDHRDRFSPSLIALGAVDPGDERILRVRGPESQIKSLVGQGGVEFPPVLTCRFEHVGAESMNIRIKTLPSARGGLFRYPIRLAAGQGGDEPLVEIIGDVRAGK